MNSENLNDDSMTAAEIIQSRSEKNYEKHHEEIDRINLKMDEIYKKDGYPEQNNDLIDCCLEILELDPYNFHAQMESILPMARNGKTEPAQKTCRRLLDLYPNDPTLENYMGDVFWYSGDYGNAILFYESVIQKTPYTEYQALKAKRGKADSLYLNENYDEVIEFCNDQLAIHENDKVLTDLKTDALKAIQNLNERIEETDEKIQQIDIISQQLESEKSQNSNNTSDSFIADELIKLAKLKEQGAISEEEFIQMKQKLMKKM